MQIKTETKVGLFVIIAIGIFVFATLGIGSFKFGSYGYVPYTVSFKDVSGLSQRGDVKVSGVKVGWIEKIELDKEGKANAHIMVSNKCHVYDNAYATVRQEGLIGLKYLDLVTGDPMLPKMQSGEQFTRQGRESISIDDLLYKFKGIAANVEEMTKGLKDAFSSEEGSSQIKDTINNISNAASKFEKLSSSLDRVVGGNEDSLNSIIVNFETISDTLKTDLPAIKESLNKFTGETTDSLTSAAQEAKESFENISSITQKIDEGRGLLGKLINEEEMYKDLKSTISGVKNYLNKFESMGVIVDSHTETYQSPVDGFKFPDTKGYFNIKMHTSDNFFYLGQIATSEKGFLSRDTEYQTLINSRDRCGKIIPYSDIPTESSDKTADAINNYSLREFAPQKITQERKQYAYGLQAGKIYGNLALRAGLFEGTFGVGADYYIPIKENALSCITTLEAFDFRGFQRLELTKDRAPHIKLMNKIFFFNNVYTTVGIDDFASKNASLFWGFGLRFADDDIKYLISKVGLSTP